MSVEDEYQEAITYFQRYPDMWKKLLNGVLAKRNRGFDEADAASLAPNYNERRDTVYAIYCKGSAFDEIARDFVGDYGDTEINLDDIEEPNVPVKKVAKKAPKKKVARKKATKK